MAMIEERTLRVLEYYEIIKQLKEQAVSTLGKERVEAIEISSDVEKVQVWQKETTEAQGILLQSSKVPIGAFYPMSEALKRAELGASMDMGQLLHLASSLRAARKLKAFLDNKEESLLLKQYTIQLTEDRELEEEIFSSIISEEEMSDSASGTLRQIRRSMSSMKESIRKKLDSIVTSSGQYLQDGIVTMRQDRFVVPVKLENKHKVPGIVHDTSASGATLFVEPMVIVEMNNKLQTLKNEEHQEIQRILKEFSDRASLIADEIRVNETNLTELDFIFAKGKLSISMKAEAVEYNSVMEIRLKQARHPLIDFKKVVPSDFLIGKRYKTLMITGPNTGGKTVALKTMGLFALMYQSGLHLPCDYGSSMCIFENIFADIGDEQSIEQSLSTFSSHMTHIVSILNSATKNCLVLFDELGAGTDPIEGAALAISILEEIKSRDCICIATTHYSELKHYALTEDGVENASMEFNIDTLSPTYRLMIGLPGKSNAFEISQRLGLQQHVIEMAKSRIHTDKLAMEDMLKEIEEEKKKIEYERRESERIYAEAQLIEEKMQMKLDKINDRKEREIQEGKKLAQEIVKKAKEEIDEQIKEVLNLKQQLDREDLNKELEKARKKIKNTMKGLAYEENILYSKEDKEKSLNQIEKGDRVFVSTFHQEGVVLESDDKKREAFVQLGAMKMNLPYEVLQKPKKSKKENQYTGAGKILKHKSKNIKTEIDLRGLDLETARIELEKYLDDVVLSGLSQVTIIHGLGTFVLKKGVEEILKHYAPVKSYRSGKYGEGGPGVTIVQF